MKQVLVAVVLIASILLVAACETETPQAVVVTVTLPIATDTTQPSATVRPLVSEQPRRPTPEFPSSPLPTFTPTISPTITPTSTSTSEWKTYRNEKWGFSMVYQVNQGDPIIVDNDDRLFGIKQEDLNAPVQPPFLIHFYGFEKFSTVIDNGAANAIVKYSYDRKRWEIHSDWDSDYCPPPELEFTDQGVPYYIIPFGHHAGESVEAFITENGVIIFSGYWQNQILFDHPESVLKADCKFVKPSPTPTQ
ncbi:MAG: hypothetical protein ABSE63_17860 [Thermoguttaceae bacterium]